MDDTLYAKCSCDCCGNHLSFPVELAESTIICPHCQGATRLTLDAPPPGNSLDGPSAAEIIGAFGLPVARTPVAFTYQIGLVLVTILMLVLPLVYLAMIGAVGWGVYYYATHFHSWFGGRLRFNLIILVLYLTPLIAGSVLVLFMIKPLFARRASHSQPLALDPGINSTLYAFIARICESVGAPMPKRIDLTCDLNASAGFRRGFGSLFSNDLVLTIGLPLVAGLNLREFAGVVAHEFGHFTQGFGMRLSYVIRSINGWFARVVYERDAWDVALAEAMEESEDGRVMLMIGCVQFCVGCGRVFLAGLMFLGHGVSCFLLRQMEYDADSYEIKVAGSETAERTTVKLRLLTAALEKAYKEIRVGWNNSRRLPEDFPAYFTFQASQLPSALCQKIENTIGLSRTGLFGTHPSDGDRIRKARQADEPGIFHLIQPASILFYDFGIVSRQITMLHYREDIGVDCDESNLRKLDFYTRKESV